MSFAVPPSVPIFAEKIFDMEFLKWHTETMRVKKIENRRASRCRSKEKPLYMGIDKQISIL
jgi:hypothetical protein